MGRTQRIWTINGDFVTLQPTGVARYAREVTSALDELVAGGHPLTRDLDLRLVAPRPPQDLALRSVPVQVVPEFDKPRLPQFWVQAQLPRHVEGGLLSFCNLAPMFVRRHIACIHDLHTWLMPESYGRLFRLAHRVILPVVGRTAARVTTVSELSRAHLAQHHVAPAHKTSVTYNGSSHALRWDGARSTLAIGPRPFVLFMGRAQPYKNGALVWTIAPDLDALGLDVYVAGGLDAEALASFGPSLPSNVRLLGRVSDDDLAFLFSHALCFLFPSRIEGFGLPVVEAMVHGCPVVASTSPCLPEVCGDAALLAGPDDARGWVQHVRALQTDAALRDAVMAKGRTRADMFRWSRIAEHYLRLMLEVDTEGLGAVVRASVGDDAYAPRSGQSSARPDYENAARGRQTTAS